MFVKCVPLTSHFHVQKMGFAGVTYTYCSYFLSTYFVCIQCFEQNYLDVKIFNDFFNFAFEKILYTRVLHGQVFVMNNF